MMSVFDVCGNAINAVVAECQTLIDEYNVLYKQALAEEERLRRLALMEKRLDKSDDSLQKN